MAARIGLVLAVVAAVAASVLAQAVYKDLVRELIVSLLTSHHVSWCLNAIGNQELFSPNVRDQFKEQIKVPGDERIVSGWEAEEGQFPFQLSLRMVSGQGFVFACGATIIHHEWALTAAHCTAQRETIIIRLGTLNLTQPAAMLESREYHNHPAYDESIPSVVQPHDIGLIKFSRFVEYSDLIQPIRLQRSADMNRNYDGLQLIASGWGNTWTGGSSPENMNWVYLVGNANFFCWITYGGSNIIQDSTICASAYNVSSQSTCQGDSGGSLAMIEDDGVITQVGVTSFVSGTGCHTPYPAGFVRPGHYHGWLTEVTGINFDWEPTDESDESEEGSGFDQLDIDGSEVWTDSD